MILFSLGLSMLLPSLCVIVLAAVASSGLLYALMPSLRRCLLDKPNYRSSHASPTPRGGGVAFVCVSCVASILVYFVNADSLSTSLPLVAAPLLAMPLALVGFVDDRYNLPAVSRYAAQLFTAVLVLFLSPLVIPDLGVKPLILLLLLMAITAVINFTNFMDGVDGLVAGCMSIIISAAAIKLAAPLSIWALVGSLAGFLCWNWSPAKVFMGDVGSTFLGATFSFLVFQSSNWLDALCLILLATPLLGDACLCVPRRLFAGHRVFQAHRLHLFQRLHQAGWSHSRVSLVYILATAVLALAMFSGGFAWVISLAVVELLVGIWLDQKFAVPFALASQKL